MRQCFVFCHGFGFDEHFWRNLAPFFKENTCIFLDLGYFGNHRNFPDIDSNVSLIGIGHSLGFIKLLNLKKKFKCLIGLNGFINFLGKREKLYKRRYQELLSMKRSFLKNSFSTLKSFYKRCGTFTQQDKLSFLNKEILQGEFHNLSQEFVLDKKIPILILGAKDDTVVSTEILEDNFKHYSNVKVEILDKGKHALGLLEAETTYRRITDFSHGCYKE